MALHVIERPPIENGPANRAVVVLVHGSLDRATSFRRVAARLPDVTVITYDRRGYARSVEVPPTVSFDRQVDDLLDVVGGRRVVGVGHSLGGDVVLSAAQRHPELLPAAMVFEPPQPWLRLSSERSAGSPAVLALGQRDPAGAAEMFMRRMIGDDSWERLPAATRESRRAEGAALVAELRALRFTGPVFDAASITVPVVCGYGSRSRPHHREGTQTLAASLARGELHCIEGSSHGAHLSHPGGFARLIRRALDHDQGSPR
jgi:pimeloyl-ACP methyl ester carboxylesterase